MSTELVRLRPDVIAEPLIDRWYAWTGLIAPAASALYLAEKYLRMMESFIRAPLVHVNSLKNPAMAGGPYLDLPAADAPRIRELLDASLRANERRLRLSRDLKSLAELVANAAGGPMEHLYPCVPESLRGFVELVYDLENRASFRLFEELIYAAYPLEPSRCGWMFFQGRPDGRRFAMNTPRIDSPDSLHLPLPFDSPAVDSIFSPRLRPFPEIAADFGGVVPSEILRTLITTDPPRPAAPPEAAVRWRYFGHACVLFETAGASIMVDPAVSARPAVDAPFRFTFDDLPAAIDYVLITHNHWDHVQLESLLRLRHSIGTVVVPRSRAGALQDPSIALALRAIGFKNVCEINPLETLPVPGGSVTALPFLGEHADLDIGSKTGYLVELQGSRFALVADAANIEPVLYQQVARLLGPVAVLFIGMEFLGAPMSWLYGALLLKPMPRELDRQRRLAGSNARQAAAMTQAFGCSEAYVYALGREPWMSHLMQVGPGDGAVEREIEEFAGLCRERGIRAEALFLSREEQIGEHV
jgi:L-ascorbate metabolism protein UlaG (beta-lactamase superfamily)